MQRDETAWAVIGLGEMGLPMALNLARAGITTSVHDLRDEALAEAARAGARVATSPREAAQHAGTVAIVVRDEAQTRAVLHGPDGVLGGDTAGQVVVLHSTIGAEACRRLAAEVAAAGAELLDAPISGMRMRAVDGTLTFLVGGSAAALDRVRPGLAAMGERVFHLGGIGAGQAAKIANNAVSLSTVVLVEEALALAGSEGVDEEQMLEVLAASSGASWIAANWEFIRHRWRHEHPLAGPGVADMVGKDLRLAVGLAAESGVPVPGVALAAQLVPGIVGQGDGPAGRRAGSDGDAPAGTRHVRS